MLVVTLVACPVFAQQSRTELLSTLQEEKAQDLRPYEPNIVERALAQIRDPTVSEAVRGVYPVFGGIISGAGFLRGGAAYRRNFGDAGGFWITDARLSNRGYWQVGALVQVPRLFRGVLGVGGDVYQQHASGVSFYGIGNSTSASDRARFVMDTTSVGLNATVRPLSIVSIGGRVGYLNINTGADADPPIETRFAPDTVPGLGTDVAYLHNETFVDVDWRESPGYTRRGGWFRSRIGSRSREPRRA